MDRAIIDDDHDGVFISLTEIVHWLTTYAEKVPDVGGRDDVQAVIWARNRAHHQLASLIGENADGAYCWRPAAVLPAPDEARFQDEKREGLYVTHLENRRLIDVFRSLEPIMGSEPH